MIADSINEALKRGASPDDVMNEIARQNPQKAASFKTAMQRGANSQQILNEIVRQNSNPGASSFGAEPKPQDQSSKGFLGGVGKFLGIEKLGRGIGRAADNLFTNDIGQLQDQQASQIDASDPRVQKILRTGTPEQKSRMAKLLGRPDATPQAISDIGTGGLRTRDVVSSAAETALTLGTAGLANPTRLGAKVAQGAAVGAGFGAAEGIAGQGQNAGEIASDILAGGATGAVVGGGLPLAMKGAASAFKVIASKFSGVPKEAINRAVNNPQLIGQAISKYAKDDSAKLQIVNQAKKALASVKLARDEAYRSSLGKIQESYVKGGGGTFVMAPNEEVIRLSTKGVKDTATRVLGDFDIEVNTRKRALDFTQSVITDSGEQKKIQNIFSRLYAWKDLTPEGINKLRRIISNEYSPGKSNEYNKIVVSVKNSLKDYLQERIPEYRDLNTAYRVESEFIDQFRKELSVGPNASIQTAFTKLTRLFDRSNPIRQQLIERLGPQGQDLLDHIAASAFTDILPRGLSARILEAIAGAAGITAGVAAGAGPAAGILGPAAVMASPRVVGKISTVGSKAAQKLAPAAPLLRGEAARGAEIIRQQL